MLPNQRPSIPRPIPEEAARYRDSGAWLDLTAGDALRRAAADRPDKAALIEGENRIDFCGWDEASERLGAALLALGLEPGDRVLFQMGSTIETAVALFACFKAGLIPVCALPQYREFEIRTLATMTEARAHLVQTGSSGRFDLVAFAREIAASVPGLRHLLTSRAEPNSPGTLALEALSGSVPLAEARERLAGVAPTPDDAIMFQLSGGTTGTPKVMPRFHGEYLGHCLAWTRLMGLGPDDTGLWTLPLIHNAAMIYHLIPTVLQARTLVLMPTFEVREFFTLIERHRVAVTGSIGPIAARILDYPDIAAHDLSSLKAFTTLSRAQELEAHLGVPTINVFGITEGVVMGAPPWAPASVRFGTVGRPASPEDEIRILEIGGDRDLPDGETGELVFRGPSTIRGYYSGSSSEQANIQADGFVRTGDLMRRVRIEGEVWYSFEGRLKDNIDRGGEKFSAEEVENLLVRHPAVADARIVAMPDPAYGEKACAYLILRPGAACPDVSGISAFLRGLGLATFKCPERIETIEAFPVTRVGKVDKGALRAMIAAKLAAEKANG